VKGFLKSSLKWLAILLVGLPLSLYLLLVVINLVDEEKSPLVLEFEQTLEQISQVPDEDNAFIFFMGIEAPEGADVLAEGIKNTGLLSKNPRYQAYEKILPDINLLEDEHYQIISECKEVSYDREQCSKSLYAKKQEIDALLNDTKLLQSRYEAMSTLNAWHEIIPENTSHGVIGDYFLLEKLFNLRMLSIWRNAERNSLASTLAAIKQEAMFRKMVIMSSHTRMGRTLVFSKYENFLRWVNIILADLSLPLGSITNLETVLPTLEPGPDPALIALGEWQFASAFFKQVFNASENQDNKSEMILWYIVKGIINEQATKNLLTKILSIKYKQPTDKQALLELQQQCEYSLLNSLFWFPYNLAGKSILCTDVNEPEGYIENMNTTLEQSELLRTDIIEKFGRPSY